MMYTAADARRSADYRKSHEYFARCIMKSAKDGYYSATFDANVEAAVPQFLHDGFECYKIKKTGEYLLVWGYASPDEEMQIKRQLAKGKLIDCSQKGGKQ